MLYIFRLIITVIYSILVCVFGSIYCLFSPRNPKHVATFGHMFLLDSTPLFSLKLGTLKTCRCCSFPNKPLYRFACGNNYDAGDSIEHCATADGDGR